MITYNVGLLHLSIINIENVSQMTIIFVITVQIMTIYNNDFIMYT